MKCATIAAIHAVVNLATTLTVSVAIGANVVPGLLRGGCGTESSGRSSPTPEVMMSDPIIVSKWKYNEPPERTEEYWTYEALLDTFGEEDDGNVVTPLVFRCQRYEEKLDNMAMLIRRMVRAVPHDQLKEQAMDYLDREWPLDKNAILRDSPPPTR